MAELSLVIIHENSVIYQYFYFLDFFDKLFGVQHVDPVSKIA